MKKDTIIKATVCVDERVSVSRNECRDVLRTVLRQYRAGYVYRNAHRALYRALAEKHLTRLAAKTEWTNQPSVGIKTKFIFTMMKMMHAKGWDSSPTEKDYWRSRGWLGKARPWKK